jgi:hypothetical protein
MRIDPRAPVCVSSLFAVPLRSLNKPGQSGNAR